MKKLSLLLALAFSASLAHATAPTDTPTVTSTITPTPTKTWTPDNSAQYLYVAPKSNSYIAKFSWPAAQFLGYINLSLSGNRPVSSVHGFTRDSNGQYWMIIQSNDSRYLSTLDINTGVVNPVRLLDQYVTSLALDDAGNVFTVTGGEASVSRFWVSSVDANGHVTPVGFDGDGDSGQGIAFDYDQHRLLHAAGNPLNRLDYFYLPLTSSSAPILINGDMRNSGIGSTTHSLAYAGNGNILMGVDQSVYLVDASGAEQGSQILSLDDNIMGMVLTHDNATLQPAPAVAAGQSYYWIPNVSTTLNQYSLPDLSLQRSQALSLSYGAETLGNIYGMARNPQNGDIWVAGQSSSTFNSNNYFVGKLQTSTGVISSVTGTGEAIYSLAFKPTGELYASTTNNGTHPRSIVKVGFNGSATLLLSRTASTLNGWDTDQRALAYNSGDGNFYLACQYNFESIISFSGTADIHSVRSVMSSNDSLWGASDALQLYQPGWMLAQLGSYVVALSQSGEHRIYGKINGYSTSTQGAALIAGNLIPTETPTPSLTNTPTGSYTPTITQTPTRTFTVTPTFTITPTFTGTPYASLSGMRIYAADHDRAVIHEFDPSTGKDSRVLNVFVDAGQAPAALRGLALDPSSGIYYVTADDNNSGNGSSRHLYSVDMGNGKAVDLGPSSFVAGIAFDNAGNLYGAMGCNGGLSGHAVTIDKSSGAQTDLLDMSNCDGAALFFRPQDGQLYEAMGNSYDRLAAISITAASSVDISNTGLGSIFNAVLAVAGLSDGNLIMSDFQGRIVALDSQSGALMGQVGKFPYEVKGMIVSSPISGFASKPYFTPQPRLTVPASTRLLGADAYDANLVVIDPVTFSVTGQFTLSGVSNISGYSGLAYDSVGGLTYAVARIAGNNGVRHLISFDSSGAATDIGNLNDYVAGIAFDGSGALYGIMGNSGGSTGKIVPIDKSNGVTGTAVASTSSNGVSIAYDPDNSLFYTATGNGFNNFNSYDPASSFSATNIPVPSGQSRVQAAVALVYLGNGTFILEDRGNTLRYLNSNGSFEAGTPLQNAVGNGNAELKGLALVPASSLPTVVPTATALPTPSGKVLLALPAFSSIIYKVALDHPDQILSSYQLSLPGYDFNDNNGMALDPVSGLYYLAMSLNNSSNNGVRYLITFNAATAQSAVVGAFPAGSYIAGLAFDASGQLYAVYGDNASSHAGDVATVNKATAALGTPFAAGSASGEAIAFDPQTGGIFKAAANGPMQWYELDPVAQAISTTVNVSFSTSPQSMTYYQNGSFLLSCNGHLFTISEAGQMNAIGSLPGNNSYYKGLALVPAGSFPTPTVTPQRTNTPVFTPTPAGFMNSSKGFSVVGPVPAKKDQPICLAFPAAPQSSTWEVYNTAGQIVAKLSFGSESSQCWDHPNVAAGLYYVKLKVKTANGDEERWQKIAIVP